MRKTIRSLFVAALAAVAMCIAAPAASADATPPPLPRELTFHASIRSLPELVEQIDNASVIITQGTQFAMPPGIFAALANIYMPLPEAGWDSDGECHLVGTFTPDFEGMAIMFQAEDIKKLLTAFEEEGVGSERNEELDAYHVELPGLGASLLADMGKGRMAITSNAEMIGFMRAALAKWNPAHWGEGVVNVVANIPSDWTETTRFGRDIRRAIDDLRRMRESGKQEDKFKQFASFGIKPEAVKGLTELLEQYLPKALEEAARAEAVYLDADLRNDRMALNWRFAFAEPSLAGKMAASAMKRGNLDSPKLAYADARAAIVSLNAPAEEILPGIGAMMLAFSGDFMAKVFPAQKAAADALLKKMLDCQPGENLIANYFGENGEYTASWMTVKDPERMLRLQSEVVGVVNDAVADILLLPEYRFKLKSAEGKASDGTPYWKMTFALDQPKKIEELLANLPPEAAQLKQALDKLGSFTQYVGIKNGMMVSVAGMATEGHFLAAMKAVDGQAEPFAKRPEAVAAREAVKSAQISLGLIDVDRMVEYFVRETVKAAVAMRRDEDGDPEAMLEQILPNLATSGGIASVSLGAIGGMLAFDSSIPLSSLNAAVRNYEKYLTISGAQAGEDEEYDEDAEEDSPEEEEPIELDEPAESA